MEVQEEFKIVGSARVEDKNKISPSFVISSWLALAVGFISYNIGLYNADMTLSEKGYYFTILLFGLFSVVTLQKSVRDKVENIPVSPIYYMISWFGSVLSIALLVIGLVNADLLLSEKGFFGMAFILSLFAAVTIQKNLRDSAK